MGRDDAWFLPAPSSFAFTRCVAGRDYAMNCIYSLQFTTGSAVWLRRIHRADAWMLDVSLVRVVRWSTVVVLRLCSNQRREAGTFSLLLVPILFFRFTPSQAEEKQGTEQRETHSTTNTSSNNGFNASATDPITSTGAVFWRNHTNLPPSRKSWCNRICYLLWRFSYRCSRTRWL